MLSSRSGEAHIQGRLSGVVIESRSLGAYRHLILEVEGWIGAESGQFAMLQPQGSQCFLPRPYSISDDVPSDVSVGASETSTSEHGSVGRRRLSFLVDLVGVGSRELAAAQPGAQIHVLGPLGRGFAAAGAFAPAAPGAARRAAACPAAAPGTRKPGRMVVVGGGVGMAPLPLLLREVEEACAGGVQAHARGAQGHSRSAMGARSSAAVRQGGQELLEWAAGGIICMLGFRSAREAGAVVLIEEALERLQRCGVSTTLQVLTEDGSRGRRGLVTAPLEGNLRPEDLVVACGPHAMCRALWDVCYRCGVHNVWLSLEAVMACGVGSCHGCVIRRATGGLVRVCHDGPVFAGASVFGMEGS